MTAAPPPAAHPAPLPPLLLRRLLQLLLPLLPQLLPPLLQTAGAGAAEAAAATRERSRMTGRQLMAHEDEKFVGQVSPLKASVKKQTTRQPSVSHFQLQFQRYFHRPSY